ncbi:unnamed protein product, partial [marine sediment metagenome]
EIPPHLRSKINIGSLVKIPFSHGLQLGFVVGFTNKKPVKKIKKIQVILEEKPQFSSVMFELCRWMSNYYLAPLSNCIKHIIKPGGAGAIIILVKLTQSKKRCFEKLSKKAFLQRKIVEIISNKGKPVKITRLQKLLSRKNLFNSFIGRSTSTLARVNLFATITSPNSAIDPAIIFNYLFFLLRFFI